MSTRVLASVLATAMLAAVPPGPGASPDVRAPLRFAVLPCTNIEATFKKFHPLLAYLESATGLALKPVVPADLALQDPHTFEATARLFDETSLLQALALDGSIRQSAVVVVRRDSDLRDLVQLRGCSVMFGPRTSSPPDDLGLSAALEWQAREFEVRTGVACRIRPDPDDIVLDPALSTALFRIFQETLTNVARHAGASRVDVVLASFGGKVEMTVTDDGRGIRPDHVSNGRSLGIVGMRERVRSLGGRLEIEGRRRGGTSVQVSIPCLVEVAAR